ncbi:MAG: amidohydrolase family protein [Actinomycetota bacterium]|nr:amidohydrolase family protein [Actinomycetota bacterium]
MLTVSNAVLLTMAPGGRAPIEGWMTVGDDGRITGVGPGGPPPSGGAVLDAGGRLVAPGFVSAHSHLFTSGSRGLGTDASLWDWIEAMTRHTRHATPDDIYWLTQHGSLDFLNNGITTAYDFTASRLVFSAANALSGGFGGQLRPAELAEAQITAKVDSGIRFVNSVQLDDGVGTAVEVLNRLEATLAFAERYRGHHGLLGMAVSGAVQWAEGPATAGLEVQAMRRWDLINQPHFLEAPQMLAEQRAKFAWYRDAGAFGPDLIFGHFVHPTPAMIAEAAGAGCGMAWQPSSNGRLASGVADIPAIRAAGMRVGVGLDDQSCSDLSDPWQNMRVGIFLLRATTHNPASMPVADMLELHTLGSAQVLGVDDRVGSLEVGKYADFVVVDPRSPDTGPMWDPYGTYVLACSLRNLKEVYVGGRRVSADGRIAHVDADRVSAEVHARLGRIAGREADHHASKRAE